MFIISLTIFQKFVCLFSRHKAPNKKLFRSCLVNFTHHRKSIKQIVNRNGDYTNLFFRCSLLFLLKGIFYMSEMHLFKFSFMFKIGSSFQVFWIACLRANIVYVPTCLPANVVYMLTCWRASVVYVPTCLCANVPSNIPLTKW